MYSRDLAAAAIKQQKRVENAFAQSLLIVIDCGYTQDVIIRRWNMKKGGIKSLRERVPSLWHSFAACD